MTNRVIRCPIHILIQLALNARGENVKPHGITSEQLRLGDFLGSCNNGATQTQLVEQFGRSCGGATGIQWPVSVMECPEHTSVGQQRVDLGLEAMRGRATQIHDIGSECCNPSTAKASL